MTAAPPPSGAAVVVVEPAFAHERRRAPRLAADRAAVAGVARGVARDPRGAAGVDRRAVARHAGDPRPAAKRRTGADRGHHHAARTEPRADRAIAGARAGRADP